jgi:alkanesulfonate monooxygenase SsuD/methylene tetrahydromethanopterin reductase-like flavin-dependent oxidoreductase (luciferase family)
LGAERPHGLPQEYGIEAIQGSRVQTAPFARCDRDVTAVRTVAQRAEALGFRDLWVTENTLDHVTSFDPIGVLTYAAAGLGASVVVLAIHSPMTMAHQWATLDRLSGGRAILGVGLGREHHYQQFSVPQTGRVRRLREEVELIRALWTQERVDYHGTFYPVPSTILPANHPAMRPITNVTRMPSTDRYMARSPRQMLFLCRPQGRRN